MKITKQHFELFKSECQKWIDKFELNNWEITIKHKDLTGTGVRNGCNQSYSHFYTELTLDTNIDNDSISDGKKLTEYICETAKHEIIHILVKRLGLLAQRRYTSEFEISESEEELVRKLEKIIKR